MGCLMRPVAEPVPALPGDRVRCIPGCCREGCVRITRGWVFGSCMEPQEVEGVRTVRSAGRRLVCSQPTESGSSVCAFLKSTIRSPVFRFPDEVLGRAASRSQSPHQVSACTRNLAHQSVISHGSRALVRSLAGSPRDLLLFVISRLLYSKTCRALHACHTFLWRRLGILWVR